jgi:cell division protease FtsH
LLALGAVVVLVLLVTSVMHGSTAKSIEYSTFVNDVNSKQIASANYNNTNAAITGKLAGGTSYTTTGPGTGLPAAVVNKLHDDDVQLTYSSPSSSVLDELLVWVLPIALLIGFFVWMSRRAQGQMSGIMSIGRSPAKE